MVSFELIDIPKPAEYYNGPERYKPVTVVVVSDIHIEQDQLQIRDGDRLVHCDNHELGFIGLSKNEIESKILTNCHYLNNELIEI
jgi:hypothetical protein